VSLAEEEHMTIIITTHYIEEARRAHTVGFLRRGKLLVQDHPDSILQRYGINSLELAFLKICSREQDANTEAGEEDEDAGAGSPKRDSIRKKLSFTNSIKAIGFGKQASISPSRIYVPKNESEEQSVKQEQSSCHSGSFHSVHSQNNQRQSSSGAKGTNQVDVEGFSHKSHKTPEQTFRYQFNIVKTLASKGVIKFKRSIP
jgi:ABC-type multidrug transport system ATPase subunit